MKFNQTPPDILVYILKNVTYIEDVDSILKSCKHTHDLIYHKLFKNVLKSAYLSENHINHLSLDDKQVISNLDSPLDIFLDGLYYFMFN